MKFFDLEFNDLADGRTIVWKKPNMSANGIGCSNANTRWKESNINANDCKANGIVWTKPSWLTGNCKNVYQF